MAANARNAPDRASRREPSWGALIAVGIVLLILHSTALTTPWVTALAAVAFVAVVVATVVARFGHGLGT